MSLLTTTKTLIKGSPFLYKQWKRIKTKWNAKKIEESQLFIPEEAVRLFTDQTLGSLKKNEPVYFFKRSEFIECLQKKHSHLNWKRTSFQITDQCSIATLFESSNDEQALHFIVSSEDALNLTNLLNAIDRKRKPNVSILLDRIGNLGHHTSYAPYSVSPVRETQLWISNYYSRNYQIRDAILFMVAIYQGENLIKAAQFILGPDQSKELNLKDLLKAADREGQSGMVCITPIHPALHRAKKLRFFVMMENNENGGVAGTHSIAWNPKNSPYEEKYKSWDRNFIPTVPGVKYGHFTQLPLAQGIGRTACEKQTSLKQTDSLAPIQGVHVEVASPRSDTQSIQFDKVVVDLDQRGLAPSYCMLEGKAGGLALWHDGPELTKKATAALSALSEGQQREMSEKLKVFCAIVPHLSFSTLEAHCVFSSKSWYNRYLNFDVELRSSNGNVVASESIVVPDGPFFSINLSEMAKGHALQVGGYWAITAALAKNDLRNLSSIPESSPMLYIYWVNKEGKLSDSIHSVDGNNSLLETHALGGKLVKGRILVRSYKFGPFLKGSNQESVIWLVNHGPSREAIDAQVKLRLFNPSGEEKVVSIEIPANHSREITSRDFHLSEEEGARFFNGKINAIWVESDDCNVGGYWIKRNNDFFAIDHLTNS